MQSGSLPAQPRISIVTVVYNNVETIRDAIESVLEQTYENIEYIVIDGGSDDGTVEVIEEYRDELDHFVSEPDDGIYSAMNKGVRATTGDIVGILNADDFYADETILERVVDKFVDEQTDCVYGDLVYVEPEETDEIVRYWRSGPYSRERFRKGWMPPHPTLFVRRELYERYGGFDQELDISGDYELILRFLYRHRASAAYLPDVLVRMRAGGNSNASLAQRFRGHLQDYRAWLDNGEIPNPLILARKPFSKISQFLAKPNQSKPDIEPVKERTSA